MCDKIQYPNYKAALNAARGISKRDKTSMKVYKCGECHQFHLSTRGKKSCIIQKKPTSFNFRMSKSLSKKREDNDGFRQSNVVSFSHATQPVLSKNIADHLKRIIENQNINRK